MAREKGVVKWFSTQKGYGFVRRNSGEEIFVHHSDIEVDGYATLKNGEPVEFEVFHSDRGPKARKLVPLESGEGTAGRGGKERSGSGRKRDREGDEASPGARSDESARRTLAARLEERLGGRFPGFGRRG
jgi:CspA family cold shock protein